MGDDPSAQQPPTNNMDRGAGSLLEMTQSPPDDHPPPAGMVLLRMSKVAFDRARTRITPVGDRSPPKKDALAHLKCPHTRMKGPPIGALAPDHASGTRARRLKNARPRPRLAAIPP